MWWIENIKHVSCLGHFLFLTLSLSFCLCLIVACGQVTLLVLHSGAQLLLVVAAVCLCGRQAQSEHLCIFLFVSFDQICI